MSSEDSVPGSPPTLEIFIIDLNVINADNIKCKLDMKWKKNKIFLYPTVINTINILMHFFLGFS